MFVDLHQGCKELESEPYDMVVCPSTSCQVNHLTSNAQESGIDSESSSLNKTPTSPCVPNNTNTKIMPNLVYTQDETKSLPRHLVLPLALGIPSEGTPHSRSCRDWVMRVGDPRYSHGVWVGCEVGTSGPLGRAGCLSIVF